MSLGEGRSGSISPVILLIQRHRRRRRTPRLSRILEGARSYRYGACAQPGALERHRNTMTAYWKAPKPTQIGGLGAENQSFSVLSPHEDLGVLGGRRETCERCSRMISQRLIVKIRTRPVQSTTAPKRSSRPFQRQTSFASATASPVILATSLETIGKGADWYIVKVAHYPFILAASDLGTIESTWSPR